MSLKIVSLCCVIAAALLASTFATHAADVTVQPATGSGFVIKDAAGANERLRVQESGAITLPGVPAAVAQSTGLCMSGAGVLGPCSGGGSGSGPAYTAATGLSLTGTTFSVAPTYQLPQGCAANQIAQWNSATSVWVCASASGATLPVGTVNQTLRYDASNAPVANSALQVFADGGVLATDAAVNAAFANNQTGTGTIPASGPGARMMWYPAKGAFRVGYVDGAQWDDNVIGFGSIAMGQTTTAGCDTSRTPGCDPTTDDSQTAMGFLTTASGEASTAMGYNTTASGSASTAMGYGTTADAFASIAMGDGTSTNGHHHSFVFGDASSGAEGTINTLDNQFMVRASGGFVFYTSGDNVTGLQLAAGGGSWTNLSDRNAKDAVQSIDARDILARVVAMPINTWHYKTQDKKYRHMGPMAQDFRAAFGLGETDKGIDDIDAQGVALAAIQGLDAKFGGLIDALKRQFTAWQGDKDKQIANLRAEVAIQREQIASLQAQGKEIAALNREFAEMHTQLQALQSNSESRTVHAAYPRRKHGETLVAETQP